MELPRVQALNFPLSGTKYELQDPFSKEYIRGNYVKNLEKKSFQRNKGEIREQPAEDEKRKMYYVLSFNNL